MTVRIFVSVPVPPAPAVRQAMRELSEVPKVRVPPADTVHATLRFVGEIPEMMVGRVCRCAREAGAGTAPFRIKMRGTGAFPDGRRPRVVWIGMDSAGRLERIAADLSSAFDTAGIPYDRKEFRPHVTIGRVSGQADLSGFLERNGGRRFAEFECRGMKVMRSDRGPWGVVHRTVEDIPLGVPAEADGPR